VNVRFHALRTLSGVCSLLRTPGAVLGLLAERLPDLLEQKLQFTREAPGF
jgi:hypothetical protein